MDLIFESGGLCTIVDFKTDRYMDINTHRVQLACYRAAAGAFSDLPVKTMLVYLRSMEAVEVDAALSDAELFALASASFLGQPEGE
jgi:ATP-dependent exoDNAse (exonuclease V) beta subunit